MPQRAVECEHSISSYSGWAVWSRYDSTQRAYQLMVRNVADQAASPSVEPSRTELVMVGATQSRT
jgi:hypothetical protein